MAQPAGWAGERCGLGRDCEVRRAAAARPAVPHRHPASPEDGVRLHQIGCAHAGTRVLARDRHIRVLTTDGELLRELTLDPSRDYQPHAPP